MRLLADECVDARLIAGLRGTGHDVVAVRQAPRGAGDRSVIETARREGRVLVTEDKDFGDLVFRHGLGVPGLILLRYVQSVWCWSACWRWSIATATNCTTFTSWSQPGARGSAGFPPRPRRRREGIPPWPSTIVTASAARWTSSRPASRPSSSARWMRGPARAGGAGWTASWCASSSATPTARSIGTATRCSRS